MSTKNKVIFFIVPTQLTIHSDEDVSTMNLMSPVKIALSSLLYIYFRKSLDICQDDVDLWYLILLA